MDRKPQYADLPLPELLRQLSTDTATLVRQEIQLARVELTGKAKVAGRSATFFGAAAVLGFGAFLAVTACAIAALALVLQLWAAALVVTAVYAAGAVAAALAGKRSLAAVAPPVPERTVESVKADVDAVRAGVSRGR